MRDDNSVSRREFLKIAGITGASIGLMGGLGGLAAACGEDEATTTTGGAATTAGSATTVSTGGGQGTVGGTLSLVPTFQNQYWTDFSNGVQAGAEALGNKFSKQAFEDSIEKQIAIIESAPAQGLNMVMMMAQNAASSIQIMQTCATNKVLAVNAHSNAFWSHPLDEGFGDYYVTFMMPDNVAGYDVMSSALFESYGGKCKVIQLHGIPGNKSNDDRSAGFDMAVAKYPGVEVVARENGGENRTAAQPVIENLLTAHPDADAIVCHNDDSAIAALNALRDRGLDKVKVCGCDAITEFTQAMQTGPNAYSTIAIHGYWLGAYAAVRLFDALNGVVLTPVERFIYQDTLVIDTKAAAAKYEEIMKTPAFDWPAASKFLNPETWNPQNGLAPVDCEKYWEGLEQPNNYQGLPQAYQDAVAAGDLQKYTAYYNKQFTGGPLSAAIDLTTIKKTVLQVMAGAK